MNYLIKNTLNLTHLLSFFCLLNETIHHIKDYVSAPAGDLYSFIIIIVFLMKSFIQLVFCLPTEVFNLPDFIISEFIKITIGEKRFFFSPLSPLPSFCCEKLVEIIPPFIKVATYYKAYLCICQVHVVLITLPMCPPQAQKDQPYPWTPGSFLLALAWSGLY